MLARMMALLARMLAKKDIRGNFGNKGNFLKKGDGRKIPKQE